MKDEENRVEELLQRHLPVSSVEQVDAAVGRVLARNQQEIREASLKSRADIPSIDVRRRVTVLAAAAAIALLLISAAVVRELVDPSSEDAIVKAATGPLSVTADGQSRRVRSNGTGGVLTLADGSRVEMRAGAELSLERANDGLQIQLIRGSVIVSAAKQSSGHLYVRTKDLIVSVVGTVFLVNVEESGSRVAVIHGEVQVQLGGTLRKLRPGDQVATGANMEALPVSEEISWSPSTPAHLALLQQNTPPVAESSSPLKFEVASIKLTPSGNPAQTGESWGFACHGIDGVWRSLNERLPAGGERIIAPQGRCVGNGVRADDLISSAYGIAPTYVVGGPAWVRSGTPGVSEGYRIDAVAEDPSTATTAQLKQMLRTMLEDRFKLTFRRETQESPGYALVLAKNGPKLSETSDSEVLPYSDRDSKGRPVIKGKSTLGKLAQFLTQFVFAPVVDQTRLPGIYDYEFLAVIPFGGRGAGAPPSSSDPAVRAAERAAEISDAISPALEAQLGLRLEGGKVPFEILVIDKIEKPSPN
jgi:uncharacterized protein (TIGR03435 family)